jgi:opacity protein-like surface antigen
MKKISILLILLSCNTFVLAQKKETVEFGANVGLNRSLVSNTTGSTDPLSGFNVAFSADYYFSDRWSIKGKLIYDQKGWANGFIKFDQLYYNQQYDPIIYGTITTDFNLDYITIPVMANWHFGKKRNWYLNFGPYVGFLVSAKDSKLKYNFKQEFQNTDIGFQLGIGVKIPVSDKLKIYFEYEGQDGFTDTYRINNTGSAVTNSRGSLNVGLNFLMK